MNEGLACLLRFGLSAHSDQVQSIEVEILGRFMGLEVGGRIFRVDRGDEIDAKVRVVSTKTEEKLKTVSADVFILKASCRNECDW